MPRSWILSTHHFVGFLVALGLVAALPANAGSGSQNRRSMTGVWLTVPPSPFVLQDPDGFAPGVPGPLKESTLMRWELHEDEKGLITGYNTYYSQDEEGENQSKGTLCMVGARLGRRVILSEAYAVYNEEPVPELSTTPIFEFHCKQRGRRKVLCLGNGLSNIPPTALQAVLVRLRNPDGVIPVPEAAREICQPAALD